MVYDSVGRTTFLKSLDCLVPRGTMVSFGQSSGKVDAVEATLLSAKGSLYLTRPTLGHSIADSASLRRRAGDVVRWAAEAHRQLESRSTTGKLILIPR